MQTISVVIPSYNDADMLEQCLQALAAQTRLADEIVVVDNDSDDDTAEVARRFGCRVVWEPVRGIPSATARGFSEARMNIIARLDADSVPAPDWLERIEGHFTNDPELVAVTGTGTFYGSRDWVHRAGEKFYLGGYFWFFPPILGHPPIFGSNCAVRRAAWQRIEPKFRRDRSNVHDDLHLSMLLESDMRVHFDRELKVGVSARPLTSPRRLLRGAWWAVTTTRATMTEETLRSRRKRRSATLEQAANEERSVPAQLAR